VVGGCARGVGPFASVKIISADTGAILRGHTESATSVLFVDDGTRVLSGSYDKTVRVWRIFWPMERRVRALCGRLSLGREGRRLAPRKRVMGTRERARSSRSGTCEEDERVRYNKFGEDDEYGDFDENGERLNPESREWEEEFDDSDEEGLSRKTFV
jgi:hypothetical protein